MLEKQMIDIPVNPGINTKEDDFLTSASTALKQENVRFYKNDAIVKRNGYDDISGMGSVTVNAKKLVSSNKELYAVGGSFEPIAQYRDNWTTLSPDSDLRVIKATASAQLKLEDSIASRYDIVNVWSDTYNGYTALCHSEVSYVSGLSTGYSVYVSKDGNSKKLPFDVNLAASDATVRCHLLSDGANTYLAVLALSRPTGVVYKIFNPDTLAVLYSGTLNASALFSFGSDVYPDRTTVVMGCHMGTTLEISKLKYDNTVSSASLAITGTNTNSSRTFDICTDGTSSYFCASATSSGNQVIVCEVLNSALTKTSETAYAITTSSALNRIGCSILSGVVYIGLRRESSSGVFVTESYTFTVSGYSFSGPQISEFWAYPATRPYLIGGKIAMGVYSGAGTGETTAAEPSTSFGIISQDVGYIANGFYLTGLPLSQTINGRAYQAISQIVQDGGNFYLSVRKVAQYSRGLTTSDFLYSGSHQYVRFNPYNSDYQIGGIVTIGDSVVRLAGQGTYFDGSTNGVISCWLAPDVTLTGSGVGGSMAAGVYTYQVVFETTAERSGISRSAPSVAKQITTTGSTSQVTINVKTNNLANGYIAKLYRTKVNGATPYLIDQVIVDGSSSTISFVDTRNDTSISASAPSIYTLGGVLPHAPLPPCIQGCAHNNRIFAVPADEQNKIIYTNKLIDGELPSFNQDLYFNQFSSAAGCSDRITGCAAIGDKLLVFRDFSTYWIAGDGANELGQQISFSEPFLLSQDIGCQEPASIITSPIGVLFKSIKGIYLIDGSMSATYIGAPVEAYNSEEIISAVLVKEHNIVQFFTNSRILTYDYYVQKWSADTISGAISAAVFDNKTVVLKDGNVCGIESSGYIDDFGEVTPPGVTMLFRTGWLKLTGIQDFARVWRILILGHWKASHELTATVYYDYDDSYSETFTINQTTSIAPYQFILYLRKQKCQSLRIELSENSSGEGLGLSSISLMVGVRKGSMKLPATRKL